MEYTDAMAINLSESKQKGEPQTELKSVLCSESKESPGVNPKLSVVSVACRICYDNDRNEDLIAPCQCKGTVAFIHRSCLETWLSESGTTTCELCHQRFKTERTPKYTTTRSIWVWLVNGPRSAGQGVRGDIVACTVITPLAIVITYICLYSSEYYSQSKFSVVPAARWTSVSLLLMIGVMLVGYYLWVYSVIRMHARLWYNWWQRSCVVRYIAPSAITLRTRPEELSVLVPNNTPNVLTDMEAGDSDSVIEVEPQIGNKELKDNVENIEFDVKAGTKEANTHLETEVKPNEKNSKPEKKNGYQENAESCNVSEKNDLMLSDNTVIDIEEPCTSSVIDLK